MVKPIVNTKNLIGIIGFLCILSISATFGQPLNICVSCPTNNSDLGSPNETSIAINRLNPAEMLVGANSNKYYYSSDSGHTWTKGEIMPANDICCDPVIICDTLGNFYHFNVTNDSGLIGNQKYFSSINSWSNGTTFGVSGSSSENPLNDKPWATIDPFNNSIYATWTLYRPWLFDSLAVCKSNVYFSRSTDLGQTWSTPLKISTNAGDCEFKDAVDPRPVTGLNSEVYITWLDSTGILFTKSTDSGNTWLSSPVTVATIPSQIYFDIPCVSHGRNRPQPMSLCDLSNGPNRGHLYVLWSDGRNGNSDIFITKSIDGGQNWSSPVRVNDDETNTQQFMGTMAIDQTNGNIYALFYDRRNFFDCNTDVYMAVSEDGGTTFTNTKINAETVTNPTDTTGFLGDYISISAHASIIRPTWTKLPQLGPTLIGPSIWTALIGENYTGVNNSFSLFAPISVYPNPATNEISITGISNKTAIKFYDVIGKLVFESESKSDITIDISTLKSGMYTIEMSSNDTKKFNKIIVHK